MSSVIDISLLPAPTLVDATYEPIRTARLADLKARLKEVGIDYDVDGLETDPGVILQEVDAYREMLDKIGINDAVRRVLPAFSKGPDLDHVVSFGNVKRLVLVPANPATGAAAVMESDPALLDRYLRSFSMPAAGSADGYIARAMAAWPQRYDVDCVYGGPGKVKVFLLSADGVTTPLSTVLTVALALQQKDAKGLTDDVSVLAGKVVPYDLDIILQVPRGPDRTLIEAQAERTVRAFGRKRYVLGGEVPSSALLAAAYVGNVSRVIPNGDVRDLPRVEGSAPWLRNLNITSEVIE